MRHGRKLGAVGTAMLLVTPPVWTQGEGQSVQNETLLVSRATGRDGDKGNGVSGFPSISESGRYVTFSSLATNLHRDDADTKQDVFVRDLRTHRTILASRATGPHGDKGNDVSAVDSISANGRYVGFWSVATNLHPDDADRHVDVYLRDRQAHRTILVSRASGRDGDSGNDDSFGSSISANARLAAFHSAATNLHPDDVDDGNDVFVRDLQTDETTLVSRASGRDGAKGNNPSADTSISADGRFVAFLSVATNLHPDDTDAIVDVFVRDLQTDETILVNRAAGPDGDKGNGECFAPSISADGRFVAFESRATNLHPEDADPGSDVFVRDMQTGETMLVSRATGPDGDKGNGNSIIPSISADGRFVAFWSRASNLDPDDTDTVDDIYVRDLQTHDTILVSRATGPDGNKGNRPSAYPSISVGGRFVAFHSFATNLHPDDTDALQDVFVRDVAEQDSVVTTRKADR